MNATKKPHLVHTVHEGNPEEISDDGVTCVRANVLEIRTRDGDGE